MGWSRRVKLIVSLSWMLLLMPAVTFAAGASLIPMGHSIGIQMELKGIYLTSDMPISSTDELKKGDVIQRLNGQEMKELTAFEQAVQKKSGAESYELGVLRNGRLHTVQVDRQFLNRLTPFLKDRTEGTGTLTYVDLQKGTYGALGHQIIDSTLDAAPSFKHGAIYLSEINQIKKSAPGIPGYKVSSIVDQANLLGNIRTNGVYGIFGVWKNTYNKVLAEPLEIMQPVDLEIGPAEIFTTVRDSTVESFTIQITKIEEEQFHFVLTDSKLLQTTGGILQGMSGSPVIQKGKFVGAITHMFVDEPEKGAGLFLVTMRSGEK